MKKPRVGLSEGPTWKDEKLEKWCPKGTQPTSTSLTNHHNAILTGSLAEEPSGMEHITMAHIYTGKPLDAACSKKGIELWKNPWVVVGPSCWFFLLLSCIWVKLKLLEPPKQFHFRAAPTPLMTINVIMTCYSDTCRVHIVYTVYMHLELALILYTVNHITSLILQTQLQEYHFFKDIRDSQKQIKSILHHLQQNPSLFAEREAALPLKNHNCKRHVHLFCTHRQGEKHQSKQRGYASLNGETS